MSLRDRIASRPRRRVVVHLSRPESAGQEDARRRAALASMADRSAPVDPALLAQEPESDDVTLQAIAPAEFEAMQAEHTGPDGELDVPAMRPHLLAACAVDEDLQDAGWWSEQTTSGALTHGELVTLWTAAYRLNAEFGRVGVPKD